MCVSFDRYAKSPAKPQICNLQAHLLLVHQQILWLQVTMHDTMFVTVCQPLDQLVDHALQ